MAEPAPPPSDSSEQVGEMATRIMALTAERNELRNEVRRLKVKSGELGVGALLVEQPS